MRPLEDTEIQDQEIKQRFAHYKATRGFTPNSIRTMARRPDIVKAFMALNQAVLYQGTVPEELKMLVSLASSLASGCLYCQSHMANLSSIYNAPDDKITALLDYEASDAFTRAERAAIDVAFKAAQHPNAVTRAEFDELGRYFDEGQIVEIIASIALFGYLNRWNDTMATSLEPLADERARRILGPSGWTAGKHGGR
jgi:uncharacterized peroxidase-related enzyme